LDPLVKVHEAHDKGQLPKRIYGLIKKRFSIVVEGIDRIESASGINYPVAYVEPSAIISQSSATSYSYGILYARTIPVVSNDQVQVVIQISAPLVAFGLKGSIHAILAHEFLHYLELMRRISKMEFLSDELSGNLFESTYSDSTRLFEPRAVFNDKTLLSHITKKFPEGFRDYKLEDKVEKFWTGKQLPTITITLDTNIVKLAANSLAKTKLAPKLLQKLEKLEQKASKLRKKKYY